WAVIEDVNELGWAPLPLLDRRGGRDINKSREASTRSGRGGCSNVLFEFEQRTPSVPTVVASQYSLFGTATPPGHERTGWLFKCFFEFEQRTPSVPTVVALQYSLFGTATPAPGQERT